MRRSQLPPEHCGSLHSCVTRCRITGGSAQPVRRQFDIHDANDASEMARGGRLCGARPDIYRAVGWRALVELASQATPESVRLEIEARILTGARQRGRDNPHTRHNWNSYGADGFGLMCGGGSWQSALV